MALLVWALLVPGLVFLLRRPCSAATSTPSATAKPPPTCPGSDPGRAGRRLRVCGLCSALSGVLLAGYSTKAYQGMGNAYLLPAIAAVVIGGTHILGGKGRYAGTVVGTILITLLSSVLSVMQMPEAGRQIIYGLVIIVMLLAYGRSRPAGG